MNLLDLMGDTTIRVTQGFGFLYERGTAEQRAAMSERFLKCIKGLFRARLRGAHLLPAIREYVNHKLSTAIAQSETKPACKAGCSGCCAQIVTCSAEEAAELVEHIPANMMERLKKQGEWANNPENKMEDFAKAMGREDAKCVFLDKTGSCGVYEIRPTTCQLVLATEPEKCSPFYEGEPPRIKLTVGECDEIVSAYMNVVDYRPMQARLYELKGLADGNK